MAKKNDVVMPTDGLLGMLGPVIKRAVEEESGRLLAELESLIAARVRDQLLVAVQERIVGTAAPNRVVEKPIQRKAVVRGRRPVNVKTRAPAVGKSCNVRGCGRPQRSVGYCSSHYQSSRKYGWPSPCPVGFDPPVRPRGRPPKAKGGFFSSPAAADKS